jgi:hypothetical protein
MTAGIPANISPDSTLLMDAHQGQYAFGLDRDHHGNRGHQGPARWPRSGACIAGPTDRGLYCLRADLPGMVETTPLPHVRADW